MQVVESGFSRIDPFLQGLNYVLWGVYGRLMRTFLNRRKILEKLYNRLKNAQKRPNTDICPRRQI